MIKNLVPRLSEIGKVKVGFKGAEITSKQGKKFQPPKKLDHFIITTLERGADGNFIRDSLIHQTLGEKPTEIPVRLLYDDPDLNFATRYVCYDGTTMWCTGDGEVASRVAGKNGDRQEVACPCDRIEPTFAGRGKCKFSGVLSVILDCGAMVGGVWKLRTTSYNSVTNIMSSLALISRVTGGVLAGIPLILTFSKKTTTVPTTSQQTTIPVIGLIYKGTIQQLADVGQRTALEFAGHRERIRRVEDIARKNLDAEILTTGETHEDIAAEFYPEEVGATPEVAATVSQEGAVKTGDTVSVTGVTGQAELNGKHTVESVAPEDQAIAISFEDRVCAKIDEDGLPEIYFAYLDRFLKVAVKNFADMEEIKTEACKAFEEFWSQFLKWHVLQEDDKKPEGKKPPPPPATHKTEGLGELDVKTILKKEVGSLDLDDWSKIRDLPGGYGKMRGSGYPTFVYSNREHIACAPKVYYEDMQKKWDGIKTIEMPWPMDEERRLALSEPELKSDPTPAGTPQPGKYGTGDLEPAHDNTPPPPENPPEWIKGDGQAKTIDPAPTTPDNQAVRESILEEMKRLEDYNPEAFATAQTKVGLYAPNPSLETMELSKLTEWRDAAIAELDKIAKAKNPMMTIPGNQAGSDPLKSGF